MLNEFGITVYPIIDEYGIRRLDILDEFGVRIFAIPSGEERKVTDSGTGTDSIPYVEIIVKDGGRCIA